MVEKLEKADQENRLEEKLRKLIEISSVDHRRNGLSTL